MRQTTYNWIKILDEATWMVIVFLISGFFYLFLLSSISLLVKYNFILRYEASVNAIRTRVKFLWKRSSNQRTTNSFPTKFAREAPMKSAILYQSFFIKTGIKFPWNWPFFPQICSWKSRLIWHFFPRPTRSHEISAKRWNWVQKGEIESKTVKSSATQWNWKRLTAPTLSSDKQNGRQNLNQDWSSLPIIQYNYLITKQSAKLSNNY